MANELPRFRRCEELFERGDGALRRVGDSRRRYGSVVLLRKVDVVRNERLELDELRSEFKHSEAEATVQLAKRDRLCRACASIYDVGRRLRLKYVHLSVEDGAPSELAGRGQPRSSS